MREDEEEEGFEERVRLGGGKTCWPLNNLKPVPAIATIQNGGKNRATSKISIANFKGASRLRNSINRETLHCSFYLAETHRRKET